MASKTNDLQVPVSSSTQNHSVTAATEHLRNLGSIIRSIRDARDDRRKVLRLTDAATEQIRGAQLRLIVLASSLETRVAVQSPANHHYRGEVLRNIGAPPYGPMAGPVVVSGPATADEYLAQGRKYFPDLRWPADARALGWTAYYKAVAE